MAEGELYRNHIAANQLSTIQEGLAAGYVLFASLQKVIAGSFG